MWVLHTKQPLLGEIQQEQLHLKEDMPGPPEEDTRAARIPYEDTKSMTISYAIAPTISSPITSLIATPTYLETSHRKPTYLADMRVKQQGNRIETPTKLYASSQMPHTTYQAELASKYAHSWNRRIWTWIDDLAPHFPSALAVEIACELRPSVFSLTTPKTPKDTPNSAYSLCSYLDNSFNRSSSARERHDYRIS